MKSITKIITDICSSNNESVSSQKKEWILSTLNPKKYKDQQVKIKLMFDDPMDIDRVQAWIVLCKWSIEERDNDSNTKKMKEGHE